MDEGNKIGIKIIGNEIGETAFIVFTKIKILHSSSRQKILQHSDLWFVGSFPKILVVI